MVLGAFAFMTPPASAAVLTGNAIDSTSIYLEWTAECLAGPPGNPCNGGTTAGYSIYLKNGSYQAYWQSVDSISNNAVTTYSVIGLQADTTYQFYVNENLGWSGSFQSNIVTIRTFPPPNAPPSMAITRPGAGESIAAGNTTSIMWSLGDDHDSLDSLVVYLNYTGPSAGVIAGPLSGRTSTLAWTIPVSLRGNGYRVTGVVIDSQGSRRSAESAEFAVTEPPAGPNLPGGPTIWVFSTAILSILVTGLTAGLLLALRVHLTERCRRARERRKQQRAQR